MILEKAAIMAASFVPEAGAGAIRQFSSQGGGGGGQFCVHGGGGV